MSGIPIRSIVCAPAGKVLLSFDLSQAEAWVVAFLADEPNMKAVLGTGLIHELSARIIFEMGLPDITDRAAMKNGVSKNQRYLGKKMNHSCNYLTSPFMIAIMINKESDKAPYVTTTVRETKRYHKLWTGFFNLNSWWGGIKDNLNRNGRTLVTPYRRERQFNEAWGDSLFKEATAFVPQSTVADHMFGAVQPEIGITGGLLGIKRNIIKSNRDIKMINTSHDSCLLEVPIGMEGEIIPAVMKELSRPIMIHGEEFTIPVDCEIGERWGELRKMEVA